MYCSFFALLGFCIDCMFIIKATFSNLLGGYEMERTLKMSSFNKINKSSNHSDNSFIGLFTMLIVVLAILVVSFFRNGKLLNN